MAGVERAGILDESQRSIDEVLVKSALLDFYSLISFSSSSSMAKSSSDCTTVFLADLKISTICEFFLIYLGSVLNLRSTISLN